MTGQTLHQFAIQCKWWYTPSCIRQHGREDGMAAVDKTYENRLRRQVERRGYQLQKIRRLDPAAWDYGTYQIVDTHTNTVVLADFAAGRGYGLSLADVEAWLASETPRPGGTP
jgi:hypothetical protein